MRRTDTVIIGGGQAGVAMSRALMDRGVDHVVLERGRVGERWRSERWDSLRLLTPRWQSRLPGYRYEGPDPDGFMTRSEVIDYLEGYARSFAPPIEEETTVRSVRLGCTGYVVSTDQGTWLAETVVVATGHAALPHRPDFARFLDPSVHQVVPTRYRSAGDLPPGGVLVVGASATGLQLADEIHQSGRPVTLAVGRHQRMPRRYRGHDVMWWLDRAGILRDRASEVRDLDAARRQPSLQLIGRSGLESLDLGVLGARGVVVTGRVLSADGDRVELATDVATPIERSEVKLARLLDRVDAFIRERGLDGALPPPERPRPIAPSPSPRELRLRRAGVRTVLWATGYRRAYPWLELPVTDERGDIRHDGGVTAAPGLYVLGMQFLRRRNSSFLDGVGADAVELADHLASYLAGPRSAAA